MLEERDAFIYTAIPFTYTLAEYVHDNAFNDSLIHALENKREPY
jgi:hypothetical protein